MLGKKFNFTHIHHYPGGGTGEVGFNDTDASAIKQTFPKLIQSTTRQILKIFQNEFFK